MVTIWLPVNINGEKFVTIGERLREERERLGFNQPDFAALAGTTKKSQIDYEKGATFPKANYLEVIANAGADVLYILTGRRSVEVQPSNPREAALLDNYRHSREEDRAAIERVALNAASAKQGGLKTGKTGKARP